MNLPSESDVAGSTPEQLVQQARDGKQDALGRLLMFYRSYLTLLAQLHIDESLQAKADASDVVQETCLKAHLAFTDYQGQSEHELVAWLRKIMATQCAMLHRHYETQQRDVHLERRLQIEIDQSSAVLEAFLTLSDASPSQGAARRERAVLLADAMMQLSVPYREVMILHHFKGLPMPQVAARMDRSVDSVQKLWSRAVIQLRRLLKGVL